MHLTCCVNILSEHQNHQRFIKSILAIGAAKKDHNYVILHYTNVNKSGKKYKVKLIKKVLTKFVDEGKVTIQFAEPNIEMLIRAEVAPLKSFLRLLMNCIKGKVNTAKLSNISSPITFKHKGPLKKLEILKSSEIPNNLPKTLDILKMVGVQIKKFRSEILFLQHLVVLDLSRNELTNLPRKFGDMLNLEELYLSNNKLGSDGTFNWGSIIGSNLKKSLKVLALNNNKIKFVPLSICRFQALATLDLGKNEISGLPPTVGKIRTLKLLNMSSNQLRILPGTLLQLRLQWLDVSKNKFTDSYESTKVEQVWEKYVGNLFYLAAKTVLKYNIEFHNVPPVITDTLESATPCLCGKPVFMCGKSNISDIQRFVKSLCDTVIYDYYYPVPFYITVCSDFCAQRWLSMQE